MLYFSCQFTMYILSLQKLEDRGYLCEKRGVVYVKGKGKMATFYVIGPKGPLGSKAPLGPKMSGKMIFTRQDTFP